MIICTEGGHFSIVPTACARLFGEHAATVYGIAFTFVGVTQIASGILVKLFLQDFGFAAFYYLGSILSVISLVILLTLFEEKKVC